jgi:hypothetical protein
MVEVENADISQLFTMGAEVRLVAPPRMLVYETTLDRSEIVLCIAIIVYF